MSPFFASQPLPLAIFVISLVIWRVVEAVIDGVSFRRLRAGARRQDNGSRVILIIAIAGGALLGTLVAFQVPTTAITYAPFACFWLGIFLIYAGMALRLYAFATLGTFFTTTVAVTPTQLVIDTGPYRVLRHPSYTGVLITLLGYGCCLTNWLCLPIILGSALLGFSYRMRVEEQALIEQLGKPYQDYMRRTKRLLPWVV